jgi:hypothetical protein
MKKIKAKVFIICLLIAYSNIISFPAVYASEKQILITNESWADHISLKGFPDTPVVISPLARMTLSDKTQKFVVVPEELQIKDEIHEFRMFRNRYVIFGIYLSLALYYNWLTRHR